MISIVVVTWQSEPDLARLVDSLNAHLSGSEELIVIDNDSSDDPLRACERWKGSGAFLEMSENHGFGLAANAGVAEASHEGVVILNPDTELRDAGLSRLTTLAVSERCLVGPRVLESGGERQPSASGPPVGGWPWARALLPGGLTPPQLQARTEPWRLDRRTVVAWLTGSCIAGAASELRAIGPFDPAIHLYGEDLELGLRAADAGLRSVFAPELCTIVHHGKGSSSQRFDDLGKGLGAGHGRAVLSRRYGAAAEARAYRAEKLGLGLRVAAKRVLRRPYRRQAMALAGLRSARSPTELPDPPAQPPAFKRTPFGPRP